MHRSGMVQSRPQKRSEGFGAARAGQQGDALQSMVTDRLSFQAEDDSSDEELGARAPAAASLLV